MLVARLLLLALAAGALAVALAVSLTRAPAAAYACPMHPGVVSPTPARCSLCGMALQTAHGGDRSDTAPISPRRGGASNLRPYGIEAAKRGTFSLEVAAPAWVEADGAVAALLYRDELATLADGEEGVFIAGDGLDRRLEVRHAAGPPRPWDDATVLARFDPIAAASAPRGAWPPPRPTGRGWLGRAAPETARHAGPHLCRRGPGARRSRGIRGIERRRFAHRPVQQRVLLAAVSVQGPAAGHHLGPLAFTASTGSLTVTAPASNTQAPVGYYMLFIVDGAGVPSVAAIVRL